MVDYYLSIALPTSMTNPDTMHFTAATTPTATDAATHPAAARGATTPQVIVDRSSCSYRSKRCHNPRAVKLNGELHLLCSYHRRRANLNQQRVHQRRKLRMKQSDADASDAAPWYMLEPSSSPCGDLPAHELKILEILLFHSHSPPSRKDSCDDSASASSATGHSGDTTDGVDLVEVQGVCEM